MDTITFRADTLRFVLEIMPSGHVFMGTDYPYDMADTQPVGSVKAAVKDEGMLNPVFGKNLAAVWVCSHQRSVSYFEILIGGIADGNP